MWFLADTNFPLPNIRLLSTAGHDVATVGLESPGVTDEAVLDRAVQEGCILLAFDRDYGGLLYLRGVQPPEGIVYFCFVPCSLEESGEYLLTLLEQFEPSLLGALTLVERDRAR